MPKWYWQKAELRATAEKLARNADGQLLSTAASLLIARQGMMAGRSVRNSSALRPDQSGYCSWCRAESSVPVLYLPYLKLPMSAGDAAKTPRQSGFLFPELGYGDEDGLSQASYYLNLAPTSMRRCSLNW